MTAAPSVGRGPRLPEAATRSPIPLQPITNGSFPECPAKRQIRCDTALRAISGSRPPGALPAGLRFVINCTHYVHMGGDLVLAGVSQRVGVQRGRRVPGRRRPRVTRDNVVAWNFATHNPGGCGVIVAGHSTAGVFGNVVAHNLLTFNGTLRKAPGAGVVVATEVPHETVADNTVIGNTIYGNGIAGVTIHGHLPGLHMAGNEVLDNNIGRNNTVGDTIGL